MIQAFVRAWEAGKGELRKTLERAHPEDYTDLVTSTIRMLGRYCKDGPVPDPSRVVSIDHGDHQGTLVYVIGAEGYQPRQYWYVRVDYGSCSGCDALHRIREDSSETPTPEQVNDYMTLALHIMQRLKSMEVDLP